MKQARQAAAAQWVDGEAVWLAYDAYAHPVYRVLLRLVKCETCAEGLLMHSLHTVCAKPGAKPGFTLLLRTAFICAYKAPGALGQMMATRIRAWYLEESLLGSLPLISLSAQFPHSAGKTE